MKLLITSGATREFIDSVRFITNLSTGKTGAVLADYFSRQGDHVTLVGGEGAIAPSKLCLLHRYTDFQSLDAILQQLLAVQSFDAVIHAAAVGDYSIEAIEIGGKRCPARQVHKIDSSDDLLLHLKRNFKILDRIVGYATQKRPLLVAFKLMPYMNEGDVLKTIHQLIRSSGADVVVANDVPTSGGTEEREFSLYNGTDLLKKCPSRRALAKALDDVFRRFHDSHT